MEQFYFDVLVIGGGTSGSAAGIQSARLGAKTLIIEDTPWLGGMITSAGVSAFDGNKYALGGGIFGELRKKIEDYYGGPEKTFTGWISLTCFEPKIGKEFLHQIANEEKDLTIWFESHLLKVLKKGQRITGAIIKRNDDIIVQVNSKIMIEATEFGDVLKFAEIPYRLGRDSKADTGEPDAPEKEDDIVQDMTYCAILKKYEDKAPLVKKPISYNPLLFKNSTAIDSDTNDESLLNHKLHSWESFITYASLPSDKYLLNWPFRANDYPTNLEVYENFSARPLHFIKAKEHTLAYVYYIQNELGHPEWGLAEDEFGTEDHLPFIPYVRESRRGKGIYLMTEKDVVVAENSFRPLLRKDSIAVGDYFLDHHHSLFHQLPGKRLIENLPANAPFQVPFGSLIPQDIDGLILAEKSISVSHIVNGCTRLQPIVMLIGQAAGVIAALAVKENIQPVEVNIASVQEALLNAGCQLFPYRDVWKTDTLFEVTQKLALLGIYIDDEDFSFSSDKMVASSEIAKWFKNYSIEPFVIEEFEKQTLGLKRTEAFNLIYKLLYKKNPLRKL